MKQLRAFLLGFRAADPSKTWGDRRHAPYRFDYDRRTFSNVMLGKDCASLEFLGRASRFETYGNGSHVLTYQSQGLAVSVNQGRFTSAEAYLVAEPELEIQPCGSLTVVMHGVAMRIRSDTSCQHLIMQWGMPLEMHGSFDDEHYSIVWGTDQVKLTIEFSQEKGVIAAEFTLES